MLMPSIFGEDLFDSFMRDFPFYDDSAEKDVTQKAMQKRSCTAAEVKT